MAEDTKDDGGGWVLLLLLAVLAIKYWWVTLIVIAVVTAIVLVVKWVKRRIYWSDKMRVTKKDVACPFKPASKHEVALRHKRASLEDEIKRIDEAIRL
jgi:hypothetical protein